MEQNNMLTLQEAMDLSKLGNFMSHVNFGSDQSMHFYNGNYYYEDGPMWDDEFLSFIRNEDWAKTGWYVKKPSHEIDVNKLHMLHMNVSRHTFSGEHETYEECFK